MPPPVPEGDAPINIIIESTRAEMGGRWARFDELNPTVVMADMVWKKASRQRVGKSCDCAEEGNIIRNAVPMTVIMHVMLIMTREVK